MSIDTNVLIAIVSGVFGVISWLGRSKLNSIESDIKELKKSSGLDHDKVITLESKVENLEKNHQECLDDREKIHSRVTKVQGGI